MKIRISDLKGAALDYACVHVASVLHERLSEMTEDEARAYILSHSDDEWVEVPDDLLLLPYDPDKVVVFYKGVAVVGWADGEES